MPKALIDVGVMVDGEIYCKCNRQLCSHALLGVNFPDRGFLLCGAFGRKRIEVISKSGFDGKTAFVPHQACLAAIKRAKELEETGGRR